MVSVSSGECALLAAAWPPLATAWLLNLACTPAAALAMQAAAASPHPLLGHDALCRLLPCA